MDQRLSIPSLCFAAILSCWGNLPGPLFCWHNKIPLTKTKDCEPIETRTVESQLPFDKYAGRSFRIATATTAASVGVEDSTIQTLGCW